MVMLNVDRGGSSGIVPKYGVVVHDSEGSENSAQLISFCAAGGDRDNGHGGKYGGGYNAVATEAGRYVMLADGHRSPYHAPPCNSSMWSICMPGRVAQTRDEWLDTSSRAYIRGVAQFIVDRWHDDNERWPLAYASPSDLLASGPSGPTRPVGWTTHDSVSKAWHQTTHTDPGPNFPLDILAQDINQLVRVPTPTTPTAKEDTLATAILQVQGRNAQFIGTGTKMPDGSVHCVCVTWYGPGPEGNPFLTDHAAAGDTVHQPTSVETVQRDLVLVGCYPEDIQDSTHSWTAGDFAHAIPRP